MHNLADFEPNSLAKELAAMVRAVYSNKGVLNSPHMPTTTAIYRLLLKAVNDNFTSNIKAGSNVDFETLDSEMLKKLSANVWHFSVAKNYQQLVSLSKALIDNDGKLRTWNQFKEAAKAVNDQYIAQWLKAEYELAVAGSQMASKWVNITGNAKELPLLRYSTANDARVRTSHQALEGVVRPVSDEFWNTYYPPNGWGCRCDVEQLAFGQATPSASIVTPTDVPRMFQTNLAKEGLIFPASHAYYVNVPQQFQHGTQQPT